jgi:glycine/D-amino acid oxidase-like deaminating enzyme
MRVGIVGSGIAGLCAATELSRHGYQVDVLERREYFGGRAASVRGVEHCTRIMMNDYAELRRVLELVPSATSGTSIWQTLVPVRRMVHLERRGWLALDNVYTLRTAELSLRDRYEIAATRRRTPLLAAAQRPNRRTVLRMAAQLSPSSWARVLALAWRVSGAHAFTGSTDLQLIDPWIEHLRHSGVELSTATKVERIRQLANGAELHHSGAWHHYDAVVVTGFVPDALELLRSSGLRHRLRVSELGLQSCASATFLLDERDDVAVRHEGHHDETYLYSGGGFYALYQPSFRRVVAVSTRPGPDGTAIFQASCRLLRVRHPVNLMGARDNLEPADRLFSATPIDPRRIAKARGVHFAGGYLSHSYPLDSGEAAAQSARAVTRALVASPLRADREAS